MPTINVDCPYVDGTIPRNILKAHLFVEDVRSKTRVICNLSLLETAVSAYLFHKAGTFLP